MGDSEQLPVEESVSLAEKPMVSQPTHEHIVIGRNGFSFTIQVRMNTEEIGPRLSEVRLAEAKSAEAIAAINAKSSEAIAKAPEIHKTYRHFLTVFVVVLGGAAIVFSKNPDSTKWIIGWMIMGVFGVEKIVKEVGTIIKDVIQKRSI